MTDQQIEIGIFGVTGIYDSGLLENSKEITKATFISLIVMLVFSSYLIPNYGFVGASISAILTFLSRNIYLSLMLFYVVSDWLEKYRLKYE